MQNRKFGVEIECGLPDGFGYEDLEDVLDREIHDKKIGKYWLESLHEDGTDVELDSPILRGVTGFKELRYVMQLLTRLGCYVTDRDGLHVHHDAPDFLGDMKKVLRLVLSWKANERAIYRFVNRTRAERSRGGVGPCPAWRSGSVAELKADVVRGGTVEDEVGKYYRNDLNIAALVERGTVEIRLHEGTLDPVVAEAWVRFGQAFLNRVSQLKHPQQSLPATRSCDELLTLVGPTVKTRRVLLARAN